MIYMSKDVIVGCDTNSGSDSIMLNTVVNALRAAGYNAQGLSIGPGSSGL